MKKILVSLFAILFTSFVYAGSPLLVYAIHQGSHTIEVSGSTIDYPHSRGDKIPLQFTVYGGYVGGRCYPTRYVIEVGNKHYTLCTDSEESSWCKGSVPASVLDNYDTLTLVAQNKGGYYCREEPHVYHISHSGKPKLT